MIWINHIILVCITSYTISITAIIVYILFAIFLVQERTSVTLEHIELHKLIKLNAGSSVSAREQLLSNQTH